MEKTEFERRYIRIRISVDSELYKGWIKKYGKKFVREAIEVNAQAWFDSEEWTYQFESFLELKKFSYKNQDGQKD